VPSYGLEQRTYLGKNAVTWHTPHGVRAMCYGGLCVPDLRIAGFALRLELGWCGLLTKTEQAVSCMFKSSVTVALGDGLAARF
jgi:hypothetical protein